MARNSNLAKAKINKNDEFFTRLEDIEKELNQYNPEYFKNKIIFCNCDDPTSSNFWKFFHMNFNRFQMKKLISTHYNHDGSSSYKMEYQSNNPSDDINLDLGKKTPLKSDGDFRSKECLNLMDESDLVITNPPFSLARDYVQTLVDHEKSFIIIGDLSWITYKEIFPLIKENKMWLGYTTVKEFLQPDGTYKKFGNKLWYTNVDTTKRHQKFESNYFYNKRQKLYPDLYPTYDNYDAIEVSKVIQLPLDYKGKMGVPVSFLNSYNPDQFEIIGCGDYKGKYGQDYLGIGRIGEKWMKKYRADGGRGHYTANMHSAVYYLPDGTAKPTFKRIFIKVKHPEEDK